MLEDKSLKERITIPEAQLMLWSIGESWEFVEALSRLHNRELPGLKGVLRRAPIRTCESYK